MDLRSLSGAPALPAPPPPRRHRSSLGHPGPRAIDILAHTIVAALLGFTLGRTAARLTDPATIFATPIAETVLAAR